MKKIFGSLMFLTVMLMGQTASAQVCYQYTGNDFTTLSPASAPNPSFTRVTATLLLGAPLANQFVSYNPQNLLPAGSFLTMRDGVDTLNSSSSTYAVTIYSLSSSVPSAWYVSLYTTKPAPGPPEIITINQPSVRVGDNAFTAGTTFVQSALVADDPGTWMISPISACQPTVVTSIVDEVVEMNIPALGTSLTDQLLQIMTDMDLGDGQACHDLNAFANHVKAQTGKHVTDTQSAQILSAAASLKFVLQCGSRGRR